MINKSIYCRIVLVIFLYWGGKVAYAQENQAEKDFYTVIAEHGQQILSGRPMDTILPQALPADKFLAWAGNNSCRFSAGNKIMTPGDLGKSLEKLRNRYRPFLQDLTPAFQDERLRLSVDSMQFRYEQPEDCADFNRLLEGRGNWENVMIPYYHGPQGISTAWYRVEVDIPADFFSKPVLMLHFNGSDYYTDAYVNGHHVGFHEGMLDEFEFDIRKYTRPGKNIFLVKIRNDYSMLGGEGNPRYWGNKLAASNSPGWDDPSSGWTCCPAGFGIYQDFYIEARSEPYIADVFCRPLLEQSAVELWVEVDLDNGEKADDFLLEYSLYGQNFECCVVEKQTKEVRVEGGRILNRTLIPIPKDLLRLWEPNSPWLYQARVSLYDKRGRILLDNRKQQFGMREFLIAGNSSPKGRMYLNGQEIRLRGTNTMGFLQQDVMRHDWKQLVDDLLLAKLTNMNFIRTTQRIVQKEVYEYADRLGMMMQADLPLFAYINQKQYTEILKQAGNIERVLRNHPSVILMSYLNEPMAEVKAHAISRYAYERLFDALDIVVHNENPDRAVKYIDGDYQAPSNGYPDNHCYNIWYDGHGIELPDMCRGAWMPVSKDWMYGCGEFGAEGLDPVDLMKRKYPVEWLKTEPDGSWSPVYMRSKHSGEQTFKMHWDWFETQKTMEGWVKESQQHQEWGIRKVVRAFRRMPRMNSFAVHLFIDAWPNGWMKAIMDCERTPKPAWFVYRDALTPLSVQIESERNAFFSGEKHPFQVWICNDTQTTPESILKYTLELNGKMINSGCAPAVVPSVKEGSCFQGFLPIVMPNVNRRSSLVIRVGLFDKQGKMLHDEKMDCTVFPSVKPKNRTRVYQIGESKNAEAIIHSFGIKDVVKKGKIHSDDIVIVADSLLFVSKKEEVEEAVKAGSYVLVLKEAVPVINKLMNGVRVDSSDKDSWIVFRNERHRWLTGSCSTDLKYTYSSVQKAPERHRFRLFSANDFTPVLTYRDQMVMGEKKEGRGSWIICSLILDGKLDTTPVLTQMIGRVLEKN